MAIDRADWHWDSAEKAYRERHSVTGPLTEAQQYEIWLLAANHIGLFLRWIIENGLEGEEADGEGCELVRSGRLSGAEYLMRCCDGNFWDVDMCESVLPFVGEYYGGSQYFGDYGECCLDDDEKPVYGVLSGEEDYQRLRQKIDAAYRQFLNRR